VKLARGDICLNSEADSTLDAWRKAAPETFKQAQRRSRLTRIQHVAIFIDLPVKQSIDRRFIPYCWAGYRGAGRGYLPFDPLDGLQHHYICISDLRDLLPDLILTLQEVFQMRKSVR
jgi:hypothetical protein